MSQAKQSETTEDQSSLPWDGWVQAYKPDADWIDNVSENLRFHREETEDLDPVTHEVIRHRLWMINEAHGATTVRISGSPVIAYSLDFNMSILSEEAEIVYNAPYIQHMNAAAPLAIKWIMENLSDSPGVNDGDMFLCNDPWIGTCHQPDVTLACPVFWEGELFGWVGNTANQYDVGGTTPGSWVQDAPDVYSDPVPLPPFKLVEGGVMRKDLERMFLRHSRMPKLVALDLRSQIAGCNFARDGIQDLIRQYGASTVKASMKKIIADSQRGFVEKLRKIPDGKWSEVIYFSEKLPGDRSLQKVVLSITKKGDRLIIDNAGTDPQEEGPNGITYVGFQGSVVGAFPTTMAYDQLFAIGGPLRQIDIQTTPGTMTCTNYPAATSAGIANVLVNMRAIIASVDRMLVCDEDLKKDIIAPSPDVSLVLIAGMDDRGNAFGTAILDNLASGLGACSYKDGVNTGGFQWNPLSVIPNVESTEQAHPFVYLYRQELADSGGAGRWRGGVGAALAIIPYRTQGGIQIGTFTAGACVSLYSADGLFGGYPSPTSRYLMLRDTNCHESFKSRRVPGSLEQLNARESIVLRGKTKGMVQNAQDVFEYVFVGGGGYGDPLEREPWRTAEDVKLGYVSQQAATDIYGVVLQEDGSADEAGTERRREELREERRGWKAPLGADENDAAAAVDKAATQEPPQTVHESLEARDEGAQRVIACQRCGEVLCGYHGSFKRHCLWDESPVTEISPFSADASYFIDDPVVFRRFCCPGCQVLLATETLKATEPPMEEMKLL